MTTCIAVDVVVIGAGFGGSLAALLLQRIGLRTALVDRGAHPRFAIGESSTPVADLVLRDLTRRYDLPRLAPLASYGTWKAAYPEVGCGRKRGFSYFHQPPHATFTPWTDHRNELLVAASRDDFHSDTHWLRADVDSLFASESQAMGVVYLDRTQLSVTSHQPNWVLAGEQEGVPVQIEAEFLIDASGEGGFVARALAIPSRVQQLHTQSRAIFGHFVHVRPWHDVLAEYGGQVQDHPFACDAAALHQVFDEGWMYQLRFDNGVTSAGFSLNLEKRPDDVRLSAEEEWKGLMNRYPSIAAQFAEARLVGPPGGLQKSGRLQRCATQIAGDNWVLLPYTAGFIDALHSTGIAHTLCGVERVVRILECHWKRDSLNANLQRYAATVQQEIELIDQLVHGCYSAMPVFDLFVSFSMLYFAAATTYERRRNSGEDASGLSFLGADDAQFRNLITQARVWLFEALNASDPIEAADHFRDQMARLVAPYNTAGLFDPTVQNMYRYTAAR